MQSIQPHIQPHHIKTRKTDNRFEHLQTSYEAMKAAKAALTASQHGVFSHWYDTDDKFEMDARIETIRSRMNEGEDLTIGIKSGNMRNNGVRSTNDNAGWFKVDFFRIHRINEATNIQQPVVSAFHPSVIYDLQGRKIANSQLSMMKGSLKKGIYIADGRKFVR